jgi:hypothetical protein
MQPLRADDSVDGAMVEWLPYPAGVLSIQTTELAYLGTVGIVDALYMSNAQAQVIKAY